MLNLSLRPILVSFTCSRGMGTYLVRQGGRVGSISEKRDKSDLSHPDAIIKITVNGIESSVSEALLF
ncbi:uncharacterized protein H6S33_010826 [Morchella sextelata]|uniref:uncharacterized protein n=1 Tax=Morchella sextelata TaxID=1174677 RepID=UPI001D058C21|nr:uncharacterized protein H6S33_010826 [Morchella sextelata]KAH0611561.1 hypothetical protein H6S33_010826 [Morchella sextelata]